MLYQQHIAEGIRSRHNEPVDQVLSKGKKDNYVSPPRIAISAHLADGRSSVDLAYTKAIERVGGIPVILPITNDIDILLESLRSVHGLLLTGGTDISAYYLGEEPHQAIGTVQYERDAYELRLIRLARRLALPILGICRGHQMLGIAYGSTLFQDIPSQYAIEESINHSPRLDKREPHHSIEILDSESRLAHILGYEEGDGTIWVNSLHHQGLREVRPPFYEVATASDGINEAIDAYPELDILAVQWHPEHLALGTLENRHIKLFAHLIKRAILYQRARAFHAHYLTLDSHTDTPMFFGEGFDIASNSKTRVDLTKMELGDIDASVMVAYLPQSELSEDAHREARRKTEQILSELHRQVERNAHRACIARNVHEIRRAKALAKRAIIPAIENGYAIGSDLSLLEYYKERYGIIYITLCHNGDNLLCDSARKSGRLHGGLSPLGKEAVREMNRLGILIDVSHAGEETIRDVLELSQSPIVASHSSARSLCDHARNLTDEQIVAIAQNGGVVQVCLYAGFIREDERRATLLDAIDHIEHIIGLVGIEHVGIGSDFDGDGELIGCRTSEDLIRLTIELFSRGYSESELEAIWGGNFLRVLEACQSIAHPNDRTN